jgi:P4 family phage/plasmid primase-like protien
VTDPNTALSETHRRELVDESAIHTDVIAERGYVTVGRPNAGLRDAYGRDTREQLKALGFPSWAIREDYYFPGLHIPQYTPSGTRYAGQFKPFRAVPGRDGKPQRYASAKGQAKLDVHPRWSIGGGVVPPIRDATQRLWITEGVKKADSLTSRGCVTVALAGVYNWRSTHGALGDWEDVAIKGREVVLCFDADARTKPHVAAAMGRLGQWLKHKGAVKVLYVLPPGGPKGVDEYFAAGGTLKGLAEVAEHRPPKVLESEDAFTDSALADLVAGAVLQDKFVRTAVSTLGWLRWDGRVWCAAEAGEVTEAIRQYFRAQYAEALQQDVDDVRAGKAPTAPVEAWRKVQSAARIGAVLSLAGNIEGVLKDAALFDADPDILNTPSGVVHLPTNEVMDHDPDLLCTKITAVGYRPGAESATFKTALEAIPEDAIDWFHLRVGQAATGHAADDGRMLLLTGGGRNGKTVIMGALFRVLGGGQGGRGYAAKVPNTLLLKGRALGGATPEKMTLRGVRLAYLEETPEEGYLDATVVKEIMDAEVIEGRHLYKNIVEWNPTHSIFLNTNHPPVVTDTGDGAWRRLARLDFPFRYRLNGDPIERDGDRVGLAGLKEAMGERETQEAILAWVVGGAQRWYAAGRTLSDAGGDPASVKASIRKWREESDDILRFIHDRLEFNAESWVSSDGLYQSFKEWALTHGHKPVSSREFAKRIKGHGELPGFVTAALVRQTRPGASHPPFQMSSKALPTQCRAILGLAYRPL